MATAMNEEKKRPEGRVVGRYVLFDKLAAGGMATVHLGRLVGAGGFSRTVAIKRLHPHFAVDPDFRAMILDEARIVSRIQHTHVVPTIDVVAEGDELLLVMDYVHGEPVSRLMRAARAAGKRLPVHVVITVIAQALYGLHAAHEAKDDRGNPLFVVHRDVSPQNIIVGVDGVTRVLDFGVAKATGRIQSTRDGALKGKLPYMPPEQIRSLDIDRRTDIYAAAVVLWEMLAGRPLFRAENEVATMHLVLSGEVSPPSKLVPGIFPSLDAIVMRGLARNPDERFPTAKAMAEALQTIGFATAGEIGELVRKLGAEELDERARAVAEIESRTIVGLSAPPPVAEASTAVVAAPPPFVPQTPPSPKTKAFLPLALLAAVGLLGTAIAAGFWLGKSRGSEDPKETSAAPSTAPPLPAAPSPAPAPAAQTSVAKATTPVDSAPPAPSASAPAKKPERPRGGKCNPPYTVDADGIRTPKPECL